MRSPPCLRGSLAHSTKRWPQKPPPVHSIGARNSGHSPIDTDFAANVDIVCRFELGSEPPPRAFIRDSVASFKIMSSSIRRPKLRENLLRLQPGSEVFDVSVRPLRRNDRIVSSRPDRTEKRCGRAWPRNNLAATAWHSAAPCPNGRE